jgi:hypothetical protein
MAGSSMTDRAVGEMLVVEVLMCQDDSALGLVVGKFPVRIENSGGWAHVRRRIAMAIKAPSHGQRRSLSH